MIGWKHVIYDDVMKTDDGIIIHIHDKRITSKCPCCGKRSSHVHSYYHRTMTTLPLHGKRVKIVAETRRYKCENPKCNRKTFASQIDGVTERYSRMTLEARHYLEGLLVHVPVTPPKTPLSAFCEGFSFKFSHIFPTFVDLSKKAHWVTSAGPWDNFSSAISASRRKYKAKMW